MAPRSKADQLPKEFRLLLERMVEQSNFSGYERIAEQMNSILQKSGVEIRVSKSGVHRVGKNVQRKFEEIRAAAHSAAYLKDAFPDDADMLSSATMSMLQTGIFNVLLDLGEGDDIDPDKRAKVLAAVGKAVAPLVRASVHLKRYQAEVETKVAAATKTITAAAKKTGASKELIEIVERELMGISR